MVNLDNLFLPNLEGKRHSLMALRKNFVLVPTFPWGIMFGGFNSSKDIRSDLR